MRFASNGLQLKEKSCLPHPGTLSLIPRRIISGKFSRQRVKTELPVQVAARSCGEFIEAMQSAHYPPRIDVFCKTVEFFAKRYIAKLRACNSRRYLQEVRQ